MPALKTRRFRLSAVLLTLSQLTSVTLLFAQRLPDAEVPPYLSAAEAGKKLAPTMSPTLFGDPQVARAYRIARAIPGVIAQQPCFCWCSRSGHHSLLSCYMDDHAASCDMCMKEAFLADKMVKEGKTASQIRASIVRGEWKTAQ